MKELPIMAKVFLNVFLYCIYVWVISVLFSLLFPIVRNILWYTILHPTDPIFVKIQLFLAVLVLLVTLILRKYFYIWEKCSQVAETQIKNSYTSTKKNLDNTQKKSEIKKENILHDEKEDEEIKIYVEKEIK